MYFRVNRIYFSNKMLKNAILVCLWLGCFDVFIKLYHSIFNRHGPVRQINLILILTEKNTWRLGKENKAVVPFCSLSVIKIFDCNPV